MRFNHVIWVDFAMEWLQRRRRPVSPLRQLWPVIPDVSATMEVNASSYIEEVTKTTVKNPSL